MNLWDCCCGGCRVNIQTFDCPPSPPADFARFGNLFPDCIGIPPSSVGIFVNACTGYNFISSQCNPDSYTPPLTEIFYPLEDPSVTGRHTFHYNPYQSYPMFVSVSGGPWFFDSHTAIPACSSNINITLRLRKVAGGLYSFWPAIIQNSGITAKITYDRSANVAALDLHDGELLWCTRCFNLAGFYTDAPVYVYDTGCGYGYLCNFIDRAPMDWGYYGVQRNNTSVQFTLNNRTLIDSDSIAVSELELLWATITYRPAGTYVGTCGGTVCINCTGCCTGSGYWTENRADVSFCYGVAMQYSASCTNITCNILPANPGSNVNSIPITTDCCGFSVQTFVGKDAFSQAELYCNDLPQTIQWNSACSIGNTLNMGPGAFTCGESWVYAGSGNSLSISSTGDYTCMKNFSLKNELIIYYATSGCNFTEPSVSGYNTIIWEFSGDVG